MIYKISRPCAYYKGRAKFIFIIHKFLFIFIMIYIKNIYELYIASIADFLQGR